MSGDRRGRVVDVAYLGDSLRYDVWLGDARVTVDTPVGAIDAPRWSIGDEVSLSVDPRDVLAYADEP
jgi:ABC-type Fe3+/spermidine/putrescine transport system ATPase subunit